MVAQGEAESGRATHDFESLFELQIERATVTRSHPVMNPAPSCARVSSYRIYVTRAHRDGASGCV